MHEWDHWEREAGRETKGDNRIYFFMHLLHKTQNAFCHVCSQQGYSHNRNESDDRVSNWLRLEYLAHVLVHILVYHRCLPYLLSLLKGSTVCWYCPFILLSLLKHTAEHSSSQQHQLLLPESVLGRPAPVHKI